MAQAFQVAGFFNKGQAEFLVLTLFVSIGEGFHDFLVVNEFISFRGGGVVGNGHSG